MTSPKGKRGSTTLYVVFFLVGGALAASYFLLLQPNQANAPYHSETCESNYKFINPEPGCELYEQKAQQFEALEKTLQAYVKETVTSGKATRIGIWSRDLTTRRFVNINGTDNFEPASLLKLPLMIAYFKMAEVYPEILEDKITYTGNPNLYSQQNFAPSKTLVAGKTYSIDELIERMIEYSDNTAAALLVMHIDPEVIRKVETALGIQIAIDDQTKTRLITPQIYASIMRNLYNASYLTRFYSDKALSYLSKSDFTQGAPKLLPQDVMVAHKFGERVVSNTKGLSDCGIVYAKDGKEPYTFCIMTEGQDFDSLITIIQDMSKIIYDQLESANSADSK